MGACSLWPRLTIEQPGNPVDGLSSIGIERSMITFTRKGRLRQVSSLTTSVPAVLDGLSGVDPPTPTPPPPGGVEGRPPFLPVYWSSITTVRAGPDNRHATRLGGASC